MFASNIGTSQFVGLAGTAAGAGIGVAMFEIYVINLLDFKVYITKIKKTMNETTKKIKSSIYKFSGNILYHNAGLAVCSCIHGIWCIHNA
jgi:hypothetical protein